MTRPRVTPSELTLFALVLVGIAAAIVLALRAV
jgi:hypothetical protein